MAKAWVLTLRERDENGFPQYEVYTDRENSVVRSRSSEVETWREVELDPPLKRVWRVRGALDSNPISWVADPWDAAYSGLDRILPLNGSSLFCFVKAKTETEAIGTVRILLQRMI